MGKKKLNSALNKLAKVNFSALADDLAELVDTVKPVLAAVEKLLGDLKNQVTEDKPEAV
jgi:hypothetical protein